MSGARGTNLRLSFVVLGEARPAGSKCAFPLRRKDGSIGVSVRDANPRAKSWQQEVKHAARAAYSGPLLDEPIGLVLVFYRVRPASHLRVNGQPREAAPVFPIARPDALKLARGIEDALTGIVWRDDALVVREVLEKRWGEPARVEIEILAGAELHRLLPVSPKDPNP